MSELVELELELDELELELDALELELDVLAESELLCAGWPIGELDALGCWPESWHGLGVLRRFPIKPALRPSKGPSNQHSWGQPSKPEPGIYYYCKLKGQRAA